MTPDARKAAASEARSYIGCGPPFVDRIVAHVIALDAECTRLQAIADEATKLSDSLNRLNGYCDVQSKRINSEFCVLLEASDAAQ